MGAERKWPVRHLWLTGRSGNPLSQITLEKDFNPPQREEMILPHLLLEHATRQYEHNKRLFKDTAFIYAVRCAVVRCDCAGECGWTADMDSQSLNE